MASYQPSERFADKGEYTLTNHEWQELTQYLAGLDEHSLVVTEIADAFLLNPPGVNIYGRLQPGVEEVIVPYAKTRLLFRTAYTQFDSDTFTRFLENAREKGWLEGVDRLVFVRSSPIRSTIAALALCHGLDKEIIPFSDAVPPGTSLSDIDIRQPPFPATAVIISQSDFFEQVAPPLAKAHGCLNAGRRRGYL